VQGLRPRGAVTGLAIDTLLRIAFRFA